MKNGIHFISGLPRSGSTLLGALLRQNPRFHAGMSSPVAAMFGMMQNMLSGRNEFHVFINDQKRSAILRGIFANYYEDIHHAQMVFDTNRSWSSKLSAIDQLFPDAKVICCVRPLMWIMDSLERIIQRNPLEPSRMFNFEASGNVYTRADQLAGPAGLVGAPFSGLKEAYYGAFSSKLILVNYDSLTSNPVETMNALYDFIGESRFRHDFENIEFDADEFDTRLGTPGLHRVAKKITTVKRESILPLDLIKRFENTTFWMDPSSASRGAKVV